MKINGYVGCHLYVGGASQIKDREEKTFVVVT